MLARGELTAGHARALITADDPVALARQIIAGRLSVREAETLGQAQSEARRRSATAAAPPRRMPTRSRWSGGYRDRARAQGR